MARQRKLGIRTLFDGNGATATATLEKEEVFGEGAQRQLRELLEAMEAVRKGRSNEEAEEGKRRYLRRIGSFL